MLEMTEAQPEAVAFSTVLEGARRRSGLSGPDDAVTLALALRSLAAADAVRLVRLVPAWPQRGADVGERPTAPPLLRHHLLQGARSVPSLGLQLVDVDEVDARLLAFCDGTRDRAQLLEAWSEHVDNASPANLDERLDALAQAALLLA
jgi:hypothetical protein